MPLLLWIVITAIVYVASFSNDFTKEKIDKALPFLIVLGVIILVFGILTSWVGA